MKIVDIIGLVFLGAILIGAAYAAGHAAGKQQARFDAEWNCTHADGGAK